MNEISTLIREPQVLFLTPSHKDTVRQLSTTQKALIRSQPHHLPDIKPAASKTEEKKTSVYKPPVYGTLFFQPKSKL